MDYEADHQCARIGLLNVDAQIGAPALCLLNEHRREIDRRYLGCVAVTLRAGSIWSRELASGR